jgi:hypothetical protein
VGNAVAPAIVLAGALIGLGLFLGLRSRTGPERVPLRRIDPALAKANTERFASAQLEHYRPELLQKCWRPLVGAAPEPAQSRIKIDLTFGPDGAQLARGLIEDRGQSRSDVSACVQQTLPLLRIPPQGMSVRVELPLSLP